MKILLKYIFLFLIPLLLGNACEKSIQSENLVKNPSFEETNDKGAFEGWETSSWIKTAEARKFTLSEQTYSDNFSAKIINFQKNHSYFSQIINIKENSKYVIKSYIKTENVGPHGVGASLYISNENSLIADVRGTHDWEEYGFNLKTGAGIHSIELNLSLGFFASLNTGTAWFDQISVSEVSAFNNNLPVKLYEKNKPAQSPENPSAREKQLADNIKSTLDIFSIFAGILLFLGTAFYMIFVIHKDIPKEDKETNHSTDNNLESTP